MNIYRGQYAVDFAENNAGRWHVLQGIGGAGQMLSG